MEWDREFTSRVCTSNQVLVVSRSEPAKGSAAALTLSDSELSVEVGIPPPPSPRRSDRARPPPRGTFPRHLLDEVIIFYGDRTSSPRKNWCGPTLFDWRCFNNRWHFFIHVQKNAEQAISEEVSESEVFPSGEIAVAIARMITGGWGSMLKLCSPYRVDKISAAWRFTKVNDFIVVALILRDLERNNNGSSSDLGYRKIIRSRKGNAITSCSFSLPQCCCIVQFIFYEPLTIFLRSKYGVLAGINF